MKQILQLEIEKLALGGFGIGFREGRAIFVPYTAPGDKVDVIITHQHKDHAFGKVNHFHDRSADFRQPECEAFGGEFPCGGCDWLMLNYEAQLKAKHALVTELFSPFVPENLIFPVQVSPRQQHYRNKVFMPVGRAKPSGRISYGIFSRWTHRIVPHTACKNHPPLFDAIAKTIMEFCEKAGVLPYDEIRHRGQLRHLGFRSSADGKQVLVILVTLSGKWPFSNLLVKRLTGEFPEITGIIQNINRERGNIILGGESKILYGVDYLSDSLSGVQFRIGYRSFWQVNPGTMENILNSIKANIQPQSVVLDAFCGIGAIGLTLAKDLKQLILLEELKEAVEDSRCNAGLNGISNVSYYQGSFEDQLPKVFSSFTPDTIILDPPRSGADQRSLQAIIDKRIKRVIYLSCSPMTLARDLKQLLAGGYKLKSLQSFDMFPNTWHVECLAILDLG